MREHEHTVRRNEEKDLQDLKPCMVRVLIYMVAERLPPQDGRGASEQAVCFLHAAAGRVCAGGDRDRGRGDGRGQESEEQEVAESVRAKRDACA